MKLKLVVASMSVLGLVSCPVFAATNAKHKHHHRHHHHKMVSQQVDTTVAHHDYKDMGSMPVQAAAVDVCTVNHESMVMDATTQNLGRSMPNACSSIGWPNRIILSGGLNFDLGKWGNRNGGFTGENYQRLSINDAYVNISSTMNEWVKAFASVSYSNPTTIGVPNFGYDGEYSAAYSNNLGGGTGNVLQLEQAYATFGMGIEQSPVYFQVGKQFQEFGHYDIHPITRSMTQVMSETLATSAKVGFIAPGGFHGSAFLFDDPIAKATNSKRATNYGFAIGFDQVSDQMGWGLGAAYLYNIIGVNDIAYHVQQFNSTGTAGSTYSYNTRVGGMALYGDVNSGPFNIHARYTAALQRFNPNDLPQNGYADRVGASATSFGTLSPTASGARPTAAGIKVGYGFEAFGCKTNNLYLGYEASRQAAGLSIPRSRWIAGLGVDVYKNANVGVEWDRDRDYSVANGGRGGNYNLVSLRAAVQFG